MGATVYRNKVKSQSPLVGAFVPAIYKLPALTAIYESQSPLVGAFVPARDNQAALPGEAKVAIPSGRGIRSGA